MRAFLDTLWQEHGGAIVAAIYIPVQIRQSQWIWLSHFRGACPRKAARGSRHVLSRRPRVEWFLPCWRRQLRLGSSKLDIVYHEMIHHLNLCCMHGF